MKKSIMLAALAAAVGLQLLVLVGQYVNAAMPLWSGTEVQVRSVPVDPRSWLRGNYVLLEYDFSTINTREFSAPASLRIGEVVYVQLKPSTESGFYEYSAATIERPEHGVFLRGRITQEYGCDEMSCYHIKYGIEAFFLPKDDAMSLEDELVDGGVVVFMVTKSGKAALKSVQSAVAG